MKQVRPGLWQRLRERSWRPSPVEPGETVLGLRRIYIVPSGPGFTFALTLLMLFLGATNYNLGLGFALTFFLVSVGLIDMHLTWRNLAHLALSAGRVTPVFAGEQASVELVLRNSGAQPRYALWVGFVAPGQIFAEQPCDLDGHSSQTLSLNLGTQKRGWLPVPKVQLYTRFPLGLLHVWSFWQPDLQVLVYPHPEENPPPLPFLGTASGEGHGSAAQEEFAGVRAYQAGDPMRNIAWRQAARLPPELGGNLASKYFEGGARTELRLDLTTLPTELDLEAKLSRLAAWVLQAQQQGHTWSLSLGAEQLPLAEGEAHAAACLRALALHAEGTT